MPLCRSGELGELWREAGLVDVQEVPLVIPLRFESFDDFWSPFQEGQGPAGAYVAALAEDARWRLEQRLRQRLRVAGTRGKLELTACAWAVKGAVPAR